jgi:hypothetical protein
MKAIIASVSAFLVGVLLVAGCSRGGPEAPAAEKKAPEGGDEEAGPQVARDAKGNVVITMSDEAQGEMGILVKKPQAAQLSPEVKGYGRVLDPAPLVALINEFAAARAACVASSNELARLQTLTGQGNASERALQGAQAAARRDQLTMQSAQDRLALSWGRAVAGQNDLSAVVQSLTALQALLVRVDLPMGEPLSGQPVGARLLTLSGRSLDGDVIGPATSVDQQTQGRGYLLLLKDNSAQLAPGEAVTGFLKLSGEPVKGVVIPREAVVRTQGAGWVYVHSGGGEAFTRVQIPLDHPTGAGWLVTEGVNPNDYLVVTGAQQLLSTEQKGQGGE